MNALDIRHMLAAIRIEKQAIQARITLLAHRELALREWWAKDFPSEPFPEERDEPQPRKD